MVVVGFSFNKIEVEKKPDFKGKVSIKNNIQIKDVEKSDLFLGKTKQDSLKFTFEYSTVYEPGLGKISFTGNVLFVEEEKKIKDILKEWKKGKKIEAEVMTVLLNNILSKCNIEALMLSRDAGLPPPMPMPKVEVKK